jgi:hypothetical protein
MAAPDINTMAVLFQVQIFFRLIQPEQTRDTIMWSQVCSFYFELFLDFFLDYDEAGVIPGQ